MQEKVYHTMKNVGIWNIVLGIVTMAFAIGVGVVMLVSGSKLLSHKSDLTFWLRLHHTWKLINKKIINKKIMNAINDI